MNIKKFLAKYSVEIGSLATAIRLILPALPIGRQDKERVDDIVEGLERAAENVAKAAKDLPANTTVAVKRSDLVAIVKAELPKLIAAELDKREKVSAKAVKDAVSK